MVRHSISICTPGACPTASIKVSTPVPCKNRGNGVGGGGLELDGRDDENILHAEARKS